MLEFLTAIGLYLVLLFGVSMNSLNISDISDSIRFTIVIDNEDTTPTVLRCGDDIIKYTPIDYKAEVVKDTKAYINPDLTGASLELPIGKVIQLGTVSAFGDIYTFTYNDTLMYVRSADLNIINESILGIHYNSYANIDELPDNFKADGDGCLDGAKYAYVLFRMLPVHAQQDFNNSGFTITITDVPIEDIYDMDDTKTLAGVCSYTDKQIFLKNEKYAIKYSIFHELAHLYDRLWGDLSSTEEFVNIYTEEKQYFSGATVLKTGYHTESVEEYFACTLQAYFMLGSSGLDDVPRTKEFLQRALSVSADKYK